MTHEDKADRVGTFERAREVIAGSLAQRKFLYLVFNRAAADEAEQKMPPNVTVRTAHALAFRSVGYIYKSRLAGSPWAWFPYLKEKMPRALDSVIRTGRDATSAGALIVRTLEQFLRTTDGAIGAIHAPYWCDDNVAATTGYAKMLRGDESKAQHALPDDGKIPSCRSTPNSRENGSGADPLRFETHFDVAAQRMVVGSHIQH